MSARLPGPGPQLSSGRIRVDAKRAIAKLREYQLVDRTHWILEAIRAAVASGAKNITLSGDANDIWLTWEGRPWNVEVLPRLFDELVSPAAGGDTQHVRLLASAVNSALGMNPAYVDIMRVEETAAQVVRYKPDVLETHTDDVEESALEKMVVETVKRPPKLPVGMHLHLRRRVTLDLIAHFLTRPPELVVAEAACRDIAVPLRLPDCEMHRSTTPDVVKLPLGEGVEGFLAVTRDYGGEPPLLVAEHGVVLARYVFDLIEDIDAARTTTLPVRLFVDGPRMPTNASRAQVRRDKHPISTAEKAAKKLVPKLIAELIARVNAGDAQARDAAILWIAGRIMGPNWHAEAPAIGGPLRDLAKLPLVRNALGEPRALAQFWRSEIHRGKEPLPSELTAYLSDMIWIPPGDAAIALLYSTRVDERASRRVIRWAKRQASAQRKFYAHAKRDAKVVAARRPRVRAQLGAEVPGSCIDQQRFANLTGEICVYTEGAGGSLVVLLEGRELERVSINQQIPFDAVVDSANVKPSDRYRGVQRDSEYTRIERAVIGAAVRAIEALTFEIPPKGYEIEADASKAEDARLFAHAIGLLRADNTRVRGPLTKAKCWPTVDGRWVGIDELTGNIGAVSPYARIVPPAKRLVIVAPSEERGLLGELTTGRLINYDRAVGGAALDGKAHAAELARELVRGRPCALAITEGDLVGAIAPAPKSTVQLRHVGVKLETQARKARYAQSAIVVSSDEIVPETDWKSSYRDAGLLSRDYGAWELALVRAMARAVGGELRPELVVPGTIALDGPMGLALCEALVAGDIGTLLGGDDLLVPLRKAKLVSLLGQRHRVSIEELLGLYPGETQSIPVIIGEMLPVPGFSPVHAPEIVAQAIAKLAGRAWHNANGELQRRHRRVMFEERFSAHLMQPEDKPVLPSPNVEAIGSYARGHLALSETTSWVRLYVENRMFRELNVPFALPIVATLDIGAEQCGETLDDIPVATASKILADVLRAVPRLLVAIGKTTPARLADLGPTRRLLAWATTDLDDDARNQLCDIEAFKTVQGTRVSLSTAWWPHSTIRTAAWQDEWLGPDEGQPVTSLDEPILAVTADNTELRTIFEKLPGKPVIDVTDEVVRLQAIRRMARGLIPTPKVSSVPAELKRPLSQLGDAAKKLGHGELALIDSDQSMILVHSQGRFVREIPFNVTPPVALAIEDHELGKPEQLRDIQKLVDQFLGEHPLTGVIRDLAVELVSQVLATPAARMQLTPRMLRNLARAVWALRIPPKALGDLTAFETIDHTWVAWPTIREQADLFEDVWAVTEWTDERPLDPRRLVLLATAEDIDNAKRVDVTLVNAREELRLDALARRNREKPRVMSLALPTKLGVLAEAELEGDGARAPRGNVAVLIPSIKGSRGVHVHRDMHPLGTMTDPCVWPTVAVIDDARLTPDRTWSAAKQDQVWQSVAKLIRTASEKLLDTFGEARPDALVTLRIDADASDDIKELRNKKSQVRGVVWLEPLPLDETGVQMTYELGVTTVRNLPISGQVMLNTEGQVDREKALEQLAEYAHGKLVRQLVADGDKHDAAVVAAHVAHALALGNVKPTEVRNVEITCFAPKPLEPRTFVGLLRRHHVVTMIAPGEPSGPDPTVIDDGTPVSKVVMHHLAKRLRRPAVVVPPSPAPPQPVTVADDEMPEPPKPIAKPIAKPEPKPAPPAKPRKKKEAHPLEPLMKKLSARVADLGLRGYEFRIVERKNPMFQFELNLLFVAGNNERLRSLALHAQTESPWLPAAIDALAAHVISILNLGLTDVTDATEIDALQQLLVNQRSASPPRSRRSS